MSHLEEVLKTDIMLLVEALEPFANEVDSLEDRRRAQELVKRYNALAVKWDWTTLRPPKLSGFITFNS